MLALDCLGAADAGAGALIVGTDVVEEALIVGTAVVLGRGEGAADGRGDGAADGLGEGAADGRGEEAEAGPSLVLILSFVVVVGSGIGEWMAGGVEIPDETLTGTGLGRGAAAGGAGAGVTTGAAAGAGAGTGVFTTGAGVAGLDGGATTGAGETRGVGALDSCLIATGAGAGEALAEAGTETEDGELTIGGENAIDCCLDLAAPGSADRGEDNAPGFSFSDSLVFGAVTSGGGC